jgi:hypothetical protein
MKNMFEQPARPDLATNKEVKKQLKALEEDIQQNGLCGIHFTQHLPMIFDASEEHIKIALYITPALWKEAVRLGPGDSRKDSKWVPTTLLVRLYCQWPQYWPVAIMPSISTEDIVVIDECLKERWIIDGNIGLISLLAGRSTSRAYSWKAQTNRTKSAVSILVGFLRYLADPINIKKSTDQFIKYNRLVTKEATLRGINDITEEKDWLQK